MLDQGIERERLKLDETRFRSENSYRWCTLWLAVITAAISVLEFTTSNSRDEERLKLDAQKQEADLQKKAVNLHLKQSRLERERERDATRHTREVSTGSCRLILILILSRS